MKFILCVAQVLVMVHYALAWQNISEFETGIVGALSNNLVLTSRAFSDSLTNVIARPFNDETGMAARIVNGVRESRLYIETMDEDHLEDIYDYFKESTTDGIEEAMDELGDDYTEEEIRLVRIKFISEMAN